MSETFDEQLSRVRQAMLGGLWGLARKDCVALNAVLADRMRLIDTLERIASEWAVIDLGCSCETSVSAACPMCEISGLLKEFVPEGATE